MTAVIFHVLAWPTFGIAVLVFGFAPGAALRLIVLFYRRDNPRRRELIGELYAVPRIERPFWVAEQLEIALFEGLRGRIAARSARVLSPIARLLKIRRAGTKEQLRRDMYASLLAESIQKDRGDGVLLVVDKDGKPHKVTLV